MEICPRKWVSGQGQRKFDNCVQMKQQDRKKLSFLLVGRKIKKLEQIASGVICLSKVNFFYRDKDLIRSIFTPSDTLELEILL